MKFKPGDIIRGLSNIYTITNEDSICKVLLVDSGGGPGNTIVVEVIEHPVYRNEIGEVFRVNPCRFEMVKSFTPQLKLNLVPSGDVNEA